MQFSLGSMGYVEDCDFRDISFDDIDVGWGSVVVRRCYLGPARFALAASIGLVQVYDSVLAGGSQNTIATTTSLIIRNSHILNGGPPTVNAQVSAPGETVDLRENWWGTIDLATIESWILDPYDRVTYEPILDGPVPVESSSLGELKASFRRP